jgi:hypothetical protein
VVKKSEIGHKKNKKDTYISMIFMNINEVNDSKPLTFQIEKSIGEKTSMTTDEKKIGVQPIKPNFFKSQNSDKKVFQESKKLRH